MVIEATLRIDPERRLGPAQPLVFGQFIEHMGRCIYGGIFDPGSPLADGDGLRTDVIEAIRKLQPPIVRWPGGNFVSGYHWLDGVGPVDGRPSRFDTAWRKPEPNTFGTHEFMHLCRLLDTEPYLAVNMGSGTMDEAAAWVEYCNREPGTYYADLRRRNGAEQPFGVRYWGLGNEVFGTWQLGHMSAEEYARKAMEFAKAMRRVDGTIKLIGCGAHEPEWDWELLKTAGHNIDYISVHAYFASGDDPIVAALKWPTAKTEDPYYSLLATPTIEEGYVRDLHHMIRAARRRYRILQPISIAFDEWNVWYRTLGETIKENPLLEEPFDLRDALCVAAFLNMLRRCSDAIGMANFAQTVNLLGAVLTNADGLVLQTVYYPLLMQRQTANAIVLDALVESETFQATVNPLAYNIRYLDACVTLDEKARKLHLSLVNLHKSDTMRLSIRGVAPADVTFHSLTADSSDASNTFEKPDAVTLRTAERKIGAEGVIELEPHSAHLIEIGLS